MSGIAADRAGLSVDVGVPPPSQPGRLDEVEPVRTEAHDTPRFAIRLSGIRFALPMIIAIAALGILFNEVTFSNTVDALRYGSSLAEARIAAANVLQLLTNAETGQRGYLLTGRAEYLGTLDVAKLEVPRLRATVSSFLESSGADGHAMSLQMAQDIQGTLAEIEKTVNLMRAGDHKAALQIIEAGSGRRRMEDMRAIFDASLEDAAGRQRRARTSIDDALWVNRIAVTTLTLLGALALSFYVRHLRLYDLERAGRQVDLEQQVAGRTAELRQLAGYLLTAREDEKAHLARELHDELGGVLTAAKLDVARMRRLAGADPAMLERLEQVSQRLNEGIALKRRVVEDLRPSCLDTLGLRISLSNLCRDVAARLGIPVHTEFDQVSLSAEEQLALYRLVQEALTNISKYAKAAEVRVTLKAQPTCVRVAIEDDGVGFDTTQFKSASHGIAGMRFRLEGLDGSLSIDSAPGAGTRLVAILPLGARSTGPATSTVG
jgi:signal transduction histidine kinase